MNTSIIFIFFFFLKPTLPTITTLGRWVDSKNRIEPTERKEQEKEVFIQHNIINKNFVKKKNNITQLKLTIMIEETNPDTDQ